jgi:23S rRNA pseudouridine1911/1915/1917 synthase
MSSPQVVVVPASDAGLRLDQFLARLEGVGSRARAREVFEAGPVLVDGVAAKASLTLKAGQEVRYPPPPELNSDPVKAAEEAPPRLTVLYEDDWLVVIDKPPHLPSHPPEDRRFRGHSVASAARAQFGDLPVLGGADRPGIVHRLDRETSGIMLLPRHDAAFETVRAQFKARTVEKEYRCIAFGEPRFHSDWIDRAIASDPRRPERMSVVEEGGRESQTYYEVVERFAGFTYFLCRPKTGRTHQIRVHMTSIGHSLVGDRVYKARRVASSAPPEGAPDPGRQCLHAFRIRLPHPATRRPLEVEAPIPDDMQSMLDWLRGSRPHE